MLADINYVLPSSLILSCNFLIIKNVQNLSQLLDVVSYSERFPAFTDIFF